MHLVQYFCISEVILRNRFISGAHLTDQIIRCYLVVLLCVVVVVVEDLPL